MTIEEQQVAEKDFPTPPKPEAVSPGDMIRRARTEAGFGVEDFAGQIKLSRSTLEALESDDFAFLREPVYVRGYYRKCAKVLNLSEEALLEAYQRAARPAAPTIPSKIPIADGGIESRSGGGGLRWLLGLIVVGAALAAVAWYLQQSASPFEAALTPGGAGGAVQPLTLPPPVAANRTASAPPAAVPEATTLAPAAAEPEAVPDSGSGAEPVAAEPAVAAAGGALSVRFTGDSWVRIQDADGQMLMSGLITAGAVRRLEGRTPYSVFLGNAPGVQLEFDGQPVNLAAATREDNTARLTVP